MRHRAGGLTLVEVLVTVALSAILIALVVAIAGQVQSAVGLSSARLVAVEQVRALEDMVAQDLARMVPLPDGAPNPPFAVDPAYTYAAVPPISIERINTVGRQPTDPPTTAVAKWPLADEALTDGRCADVLQLFANVSDMSKTPTVVARGVVRYAMDPTNTGTTGGGTPLLRSPVSGGPAVGRIRRYLRIAAPGEATTRKVPLDPNLPPIVVENVVSFQLDYLDGRSLDSLAAGGRSIDKFIAPNVKSDPEPSTVSGSTFVINGKIILDCGVMGPRATADTSDTKLNQLMPFFPIASPVLLRLKPDVAGQPPALPQMFLVRGRGVSENGQKCIYLNDRPIQEDGNIGVDPLQMKAFLPPAAIRLTVVVLFGKGPENETARFVRVLPVPR